MFNSIFISHKKINKNNILINKAHKGFIIKNILKYMRPKISKNDIKC